VHNRTDLRTLSASNFFTDLENMSIISWYGGTTIPPWWRIFHKIWPTSSLHSHKFFQRFTEKNLQWLSHRSESFWNQHAFCCKFYLEKFQNSSSWWASWTTIMTVDSFTTKQFFTFFLVLCALKRIFLFFPICQLL
jgi:hypothetical protein